MHVLFLGNGFDLYHDLKTSYNHFLKILKNPLKFSNEVKNYVNNKSTKTANIHYDFIDYFTDCENIDIKLVEKMCNILNDNAWAKYYANCNADIQGWIDFENEMNPVFDFFRKIFALDIDTSIKRSDRTNYRLDTFKSLKDDSMAQLFDIFFEDRDHSRYSIKGDYVDKTYGLLKNKILDTLEKELNDFIIAFSIYLQIFIEGKNIKTYKWIKDLDPTHIISFNYTKTENKYFPNIFALNITHPHGLDNLTNLVFGTDLIDEKDADFRCFSKRYQRLSKVSDFSYKKFLSYAINTDGIAYSQETPYNPFTASFIGCSLDSNDANLFKEYISKASDVKIYCNGFDDRNKKINNLMGIFDTETIEEWIQKEKLQFYDIKGLNFDSNIKDTIHPAEYFALDQAALKTFELA